MKITSIRGRHIALTGKAWITRADLIAQIRRRGGILTPSATVNARTNILVRGESVQWLQPDFGKKEKQLADVIRNGGNAVLIHDFEFQKLLERDKPARTIQTIAGHNVEWLVPERTAPDGPFGSLDFEHTAKGRREQAALRRNLLRDADKSVCAMCGKLFPVNLLVAAHKKPRAYCTNKERRDIEGVVFALCVLGCDALYERGYITVDDGGRIVVGRMADLPMHLKTHLRTLKGRKCSGWDNRSDRYFDWHRKRCFHG